MKIAFMAHNRDPTLPEIDSDGGAVTIRQFALELSKRGHTIVIYVNRTTPTAESGSYWVRKYQAQQAESEATLGESVKVMRVRVPAYAKGLFKRTVEAADLPEILDSLAVPHLIDLNVLRKYDRVLFFHPLSVIGFQCLEGFHDLESALFPMLLSEEYKKYLRVTDLYVELEQLTLESVRRIFTASFGETEQLIARGIDPGKIVLVGRGVDRDIFFPIIRQYSPTRSPVRLVTVGAIRPSKGQLILVRAMKILRDSGIPTSLTVVGENRHFYINDNEEYYKDILREVERLDLDDYVRFVGSISNEEVAATFRAADLAVFPSIAESFGKAALESIITGTPTVVNAEVRSYRDFIDFDVNALAVENLPEAYASAVRRLVTDASLYLRLSREGAKLHDHLTWASAGQVLHEALAEGWGVQGA